jgi:hypothetical protein
VVYDEAPAAAPAAPAAPVPAAAPVEAAAAAAPAASAGEPTLHDFVLNLLQDPTAMQAFDLDPSGCLKNAGLTDITPADVHDVIPLVTDLVPTAGLPGVGALPGLPSVPGLDVAVPSFDSLPSVPGLDGLPSVSSVPSLDELTSSLSLDLDGGATSDGGFAALAGNSPLGALGSRGELDTDLDGGVGAGVLGVQETPLGQLGLGVWGTAGTEGVNVGADIYTPLADVKAASFNSTDGSQLLYLDTDSSNGTESDALGVQQDLLPTLPAVGDLAKGLSDPTAAASAIAGAVPALPAVPGLPQLPVSDLPLPSVPELPVDLPAVPALPVADLNSSVDGAQNTANGAVDGGQSGSLPDLGGHLPNLPDVGGLLPNLPVNLPDLPVHLPQLPVELPSVVPNLPVAGGIDAPSVVGDVVDHTGLGGVLNNNPVTDTVHNIVPDLHLGL